MDSIFFVNILFVIFLSFWAWKKIFFYLSIKKIPTFLERGAVVVDVRTPEEFKTGASKISINIPLDEIDTQSTTLDPQRPIIVCCRSGHRSMLAAKILKKQGFTEVLNGGAWTNLSSFGSTQRLN